MSKAIAVSNFSGPPRNDRQVCNEVGCSSSFVKTHRPRVKPPKTAGGHYVYFDLHVLAYRAIYRRNTQRVRRNA
jgi:hypothetical protein